MRLGSIEADGLAGAHIVNGGTRQGPGDAEANHLALSHRKVQVHARQVVGVGGAVGKGFADETLLSVHTVAGKLDSRPRRTLVGVEDPHAEIAGDRHIEKRGIHAELQEGREQLLIHGIVGGQHIAVPVFNQLVDAAVKDGLGVVGGHRGETPWQLYSPGRLERRSPRMLMFC